MYSIFRDLAIIILSAKFFALVARKCKAPQVVGEILAGLLIGPCLLNLVQTSDTISTFAEIGVVLLMFTTGLGTNLKELLRAGPIATLIACIGVFVPLVGGTLLYSAFYGFSAVGSPEFYRALFIGTIMTATSVSITVATLQELGHLKSFLGTTIVSAAVIDDVIGIIVLTCVLGASSGEGTGIGGVLIQTALFFLVAVGIGLVIHYAMKWLDARIPSASPSSALRSALPWPTSLSSTSALPILPARTLRALFFARCRTHRMSSAALTSATMSSLPPCSSPASV
jgi:Kef-type K+ transport system membrane component KefB